MQEFGLLPIIRRTRRPLVLTDEQQVSTPGRPVDGKIEPPITLTPVKPGPIAPVTQLPPQVTTATGTESQVSNPPATIKTAPEETNGTQKKGPKKDAPLVSRGRTAT